MSDISTVKADFSNTETALLSIVKELRLRSGKIGKEGLCGYTTPHRPCFR